mmetsp:Transcript_38512/g.108847  ORF Transcript_38512/g.108847 Transcript_38512/m.108847 type:complete len:185 (+) Transcript_38512:179-733(+)
MCIDLRKLNDATTKDRYPMPRVEDLIAAVSGAKLFTTIDLKSAFNSVVIQPGDRAKTGFYSGDGNALKQYSRLAMGLANAPSNFQRLTGKVLAGVEAQHAQRNGRASIPPAYRPTQSAPLPMQPFMRSQGTQMWEHDCRAATEHHARESAPTATSPVAPHRRVNPADKGFVNNFLGDLIIYSGT